MLNNIMLITSVMNVPNIPLSYSQVRSVFSREERFDQTKKTILSIKDKLPHCKIMIVECTDLNDIERSFFDDNCDYVLNIWDKKYLHKDIFGTSKSLGEGTMTIAALEYIESQNIEYDYFYKISGRYWLNENFLLNEINNNVFKRINKNENNILTALYKMDKETQKMWLSYLKNNIEKMRMNVGYEILMGGFVKNKNKIIVDTIGLSGYVTVCGSFYNG